jgi:hypothetical protein
MLINLAFLDPVQHSFGHSSRESWVALAWADYQIGRLLNYLIDNEILDKTLIVVIADHGQSNTWIRIPLGKILSNEGIKASVAADGSFASIFLEKISDLEKAVQVLEGLDCIDGLWYEDSFDDVRIRTPYTGDIAVSMAPPYEAFSRIRPPFLGIHGGLQQRFVPIVFFGPNIKREFIGEHASLVDIVPTICEITGFPLPSDAQGSVLPIIDRGILEAPNMTPKFIEYPKVEISYVTLLFLFLSVVSLLTSMTFWLDQRRHILEISRDNLTDIVLLLLLTMSVVFAYSSAFYSYILNLYAIPGIQPDSFLVAMDFGIVGSFLISFLLVLVILWYAPIMFRVLFQRINRRRKVIIRVVPISIILLIIPQILFSLLSSIVKIPLSMVFEIFILFFFGGLFISYLYRVTMIRKYVVYRKKNAIYGTIISGIFTALAWFYLLMFVLFPNYLYEIGLTVF